MNAQKVDLVEGGGSAGGATRRFFEMPGTNGELFEKVTDKDPSFAPAYAGFARGLRLSGVR
jgi:hypothetical protein